METPGIQTLTISAGVAEITADIVIEDVTLSLAVPTVVPLDGIVDVTVSASTIAGPINNVTAILRNSAGELRDHTIDIINGQAQTQLYGGAFRGSGVLSVQLASKETSQAFEVKSVGGITNPTPSVNAIFGDVTTDGTMTITESDGTAHNFDYAAQTSITVTGTPNEIVPLSLGSLVSPVIEPVLDYPMHSIGPNNQVFDRYEVIHGNALNVSSSRDSYQGFRGSFTFGLETTVKIPNHAALDKANNIGVSFNFKPIPSGSPSPQNTILVAYDLRKQTISLTADNRVQYQIETNTGTYSVVSAPVIMSAWHQVAAHYKDNQLWLEVDGTLTTLPATGDLIGHVSLSAIRLGDQFTGLMSEFKVIDWTFPILATFSNGATNMDVTIDSTGQAVVPVISTGQMGLRNVAVNQDFGIINFFIPTASADIFDGAAGLVMNIKAGAEKVSAALVTSVKAELVFYEGIARGIFLGDTTTTQGAVADFLVGFIPFYGDGRDIALHKYYELNNDARYDELTVLLSYIGLSADTASAIGLLAIPVSGGTSVTLTVIGQVFKQASRVLKAVNSFIPRSGPFRKVLINTLREALVAAKKGNWERVANSLSVIQLLIVVMEFADLRTLIMSAIDSPKAFESWAKYLAGYISNPTLAHADDLQWLDFFIPKAHAETVGAFKKVLDDILLNGGKVYSDTTRMGKQLRDVIKALEKVADNTDLGKLKYSSKTLTALLYVFRASGRKGFENFVHYGRYGGIDSVHTVRETMEDIAALPVGLLVPIALKLGENGLTKVFTYHNGFSGYINTLRAGAAHHIKVIRRTQDSADPVAAIEVSHDVIGASGNKIGRVEVDVETIGGVWKDAKAKNPTKENLTNYFTSGIKFAENATPGQLYKYLIKFYQNGFKNVELVFDGRALGKETEIAGWLFDTLKNASYATKKMFIDDLGIARSIAVPEGLDKISYLFTNVFLADMDTELKNLVKVEV